MGRERRGRGAQRARVLRPGSRLAAGPCSSDCGCTWRGRPRPVVRQRGRDLPAGEAPATERLLARNSLNGRRGSASIESPRRAPRSAAGSASAVDRRRHGQLRPLRSRALPVAGVPADREAWIAAAGRASTRSSPSASLGGAEFASRPRAVGLTQSGVSTSPQAQWLTPARRACEPGSDLTRTPLGSI
jgi:hypothetical protein